MVKVRVWRSVKDPHLIFQRAMLEHSPDHCSEIAVGKQIARERTFHETEILYALQHFQPDRALELAHPNPECGEIIPFAEAVGDLDDALGLKGALIQNPIAKVRRDEAVEVSPDPHMRHRPDSLEDEGARLNTWISAVLPAGKTSIV